MMKKQPSKRVTKAWSSLPRQSMAGNKKALSRDAEHKMRALTRRVENYKRRETTLQREVAEAETLVKAERERGGDGNPVDLASEATQWMDALGKMRGAGREHPNFNSRGEIDVAYENARGRTDDILDEQQKDMLRAFRARLFDRQQELAALRARRDEKAASWIGRVRQLESDNDYAKETTCTLQRNSSTLMARNRELRRKNGEGGKARKALVDQLVLSKRCRATLREELQQLEEDLATASQPRLARARAPPPTYVNEPVRGAAAAKRLRDELSATRKALGEWRERHGACTRLSADLQHLLWTFCQRVRGTIDAETKGALERPRPSTANLQRPSTAPTKAPPRAKSAGLGARGPPAKPGQWYSVVADFDWDTSTVSIDVDDGLTICDTSDGITFNRSAFGGIFLNNYSNFTAHFADIEVEYSVASTSFPFADCRDVSDSDSDSNSDDDSDDDSDDSAPDSDEA
ncbi:hypothetical protein SO694_00122083 [Aureococcus anophagefferens]|uniref:Uncharacterized protein n=1 Tax=Aureococcus anophagefferens TaxID=44056 RepID=A0ABR1G3N9_AURAN